MISWEFLQPFIFGIFSIVGLLGIYIFTEFKKDIEEDIEATNQRLTKKSEELRDLEKKVRGQMTKEDVKEVVKMAILEIKQEFHQDRGAWELALKDIKNDIHNIKNSQAGKDSVMLEVLQYLKEKK